MKLKEGEELIIKEFIGNSSIILIALDAQGEINYVSNEVERLLGYTSDELMGKHLTAISVENDKQAIDQLLNVYSQPNSNGKPGKLKFQLYTKSREPVMIQFTMLSSGLTDSNTILLYNTGLNEHTEAGEHFRDLVEHSPNAMILADESGKIVMLNPQTEKLFGYAKNELLDKNIEILVPKDKKLKHVEHRHSFHKNPVARPMGAGRDLAALTKDGREIPIEIGLTPLKRTDGNYILATITDISERKKHEESLQLYTRKIEEKNKELEQFTFIASHDLREPLNSIDGIVGLILEDDLVNKEDEVYRFLSLIEKSTSRMKSLVAGLLDYSRLGSSQEFVNTDLNLLVQNVIDDLNALINGGEETQISIDTLPSLPVYPLEMRLLFQNLISNAIKYRRKGIPARIQITVDRDDTKWIFSVRDNGIGIPENQYQKIFQLFQRLHNRDEFEGIGIGLAHCKKIVDLHGGELWVESRVDHGSTFYFSIPVKTNNDEN